MISTYKTFKKTPYKNLVSIPSHWAVVRLKYLVSCNDNVITVNENDDFEINYIEIGDVNIEKGIENYSTININEAPSRARRKVETNDIIISTVRTYLKSIAKIPSHFNGFIASTGFVVLRSKKVNPDFLHYIVQNETFIEEIISMSVGASYPSISSSNLLSIAVPFPSPMEQTKIAQYLDHQTSIIDQLIQQKEKLIELLKEKRQAVINEAVTKGLDPNAKMKDSKIEWLGEVPEHWAESKIKYAANIQGRVGFKGYTKEDIVGEGAGALTLGAKHIDKENNLDLKSPEFIKWDKYEESPEIMVKLDDVIFTQRGSLGKVCHINYDIGKATINPSMVILGPVKVYPRFLYYWLCGSRIQNEVEILQSNTAVPMISQYQLSNFPILLPPLAEQIEIVKIIDNTLSSIKVLVSKVNIQIKDLKEYRQSIISEAVTGKIDVRDWQPNKKQMA
jgi:type I restriction enzyme S subunit